MNTALLPFALALPLVAPAQESALPTEPVARGELGERMYAHLDRLTGLGFSGSAAVARGGEVIFAGAFGEADRSGGVPMSLETTIPMGSISKHFTAALILALEADGALKLDDTLDRFFENVPADKRAITVHQLLAHQSGLPEAMSLRHAGTRESYVQAVLGGGLAFPPGAEFGYSNTGYALLAAIAEVVTGEDVESLLSAHVLEPAGMASTGIASGAERRPARGYIDGRDVGTLAASHGGRPGWGLVGAGGLVTTPLDMLRWNRALDAGTVLGAESYAKLTTPHSDLGDFAYGYGTGIEQSMGGTPRLGHNGSNDVFSADFRRYPDDELVIYVAGNDATAYAMDVAEALEAMAFGGQVELPPKVTQLPDEMLRRYVGEWELEGGATVTVGLENGALTFASGDEAAAALLFPLQGRRATRRDELATALVAGFEKALLGDFADLHRLLDPYVPRAEFEDMHGELLRDVERDFGAPKRIRAVTGFHRFGEIALVAVLEMERGEAKVEYSFGDEEVGSIRFLQSFPARVARPVDPGTFVAYDLGSGERWTVGFALDANETPKQLVLERPGGDPVKASRR